MRRFFTDIQGGELSATKSTKKRAWCMHRRGSSTSNNTHPNEKITSPQRRTNDASRTRSSASSFFYPHEPAVHSSSSQERPSVFAQSLQEPRKPSPCRHEESSSPSSVVGRGGTSSSSSPRRLASSRAEVLTTEGGSPFVTTAPAGIRSPREAPIRILTLEQEGPYEAASSASRQADVSVAPAASLSDVQVCSTHRESTEHSPSAPIAPVDSTSPSAGDSPHLGFSSQSPVGSTREPEQLGSSPPPHPQNYSIVSSQPSVTTMSTTAGGGAGIDDRPLLGGNNNNEQRAQQGDDDEVRPPNDPPSYGSTEGGPQAAGNRHSGRLEPQTLPPLEEEPSSPRTSRFAHTVAIVNPLSGERSAAEFVYQCLCDDLGPNRVLKLSKEVFQDPRPIRQMIERTIRCDGQRGTVVVSGGDGTVAFIMSQIDVLAEANGVDSIVVVDGVGALSPTASSDSGGRSPMMPAVAVLALGTGNDFSNCMGFGNGYTKHKVCCMCVCCVNHVSTVLSAVVSAPATPFDRWAASIKSIQPVSSSSVATPPPPPKPFVVPPRETIFMNYFSFGMDAFIAAHFDRLRKKYPSFFQYRFQNKGWYGGLGIYGWAKCGRLNPLISKMQLLINPADARHGASSSAPSAPSPPTRTSAAGAAGASARTMVSSVLPPQTKALVLSNVNSYSGGTVLWHPGSKSGAQHCITKTPSRVYINDKQLEVQAIGGLVDMTMLQMKIGNGADKIAQAKEIVITIGSSSTGLKTPVPLQADGEPIGCLTEASEVHVRLYPRQIFVRCANPEVVKRIDPVDVVHLL